MSETDDLTTVRRKLRNRLAHNYNGNTFYDGRHDHSGDQDSRYREYKLDLEVSEFRGTSAERRPDAVTPDYKTAFSIGPTEDGVPIDMENQIRWRVRADSGFVYICRESASGDDWDSESILFRYGTDQEILEIDLAFDFNGRSFICAERESTREGGPSEIWIYWYNPFRAAFTFNFLGYGRNPRAILDDPYDPVYSDILLFYVTIQEQHIVYRQQREQYEIVHETPVLRTPNSFEDFIYLEEVAHTTDRRIALLFTKRNVPRGTYTFDWIESAAYPIVLPPDKFDAVIELTGPPYIETVVILVNVAYETSIPEPATAYIDQESLTTESLTFWQVQLADAIIDVVPFGLTGEAYDEPNDMRGSVGVTQVLLEVILIEHTLYDTPAFTASMALNSVLLEEILIVHDLYEREEMQTSLAINSIELVVP